MIILDTKQSRPLHFLKSYKTQGFLDFLVVFNFYLQNFMNPYHLTWNTAPKGLTETMSADSRVIL